MLFGFLQKQLWSFFVFNEIESSPVTVTVRWSVDAVTLLMVEAFNALSSANKQKG